MKYYLYRITNLVNGKIYVGVHKTKNESDGYMGSGKIIKAAIAKYGVENFQKEILEYFDSAAEMYEREKEFVTQEFLDRDDVYNLRRGGFGGFDYINTQNIEARIEKNRRARTNANVTMIEKYGSLCPPKAREKSKLRFKTLHAAGEMKYDNFKGKIHTTESKEKMSIAASKRVGVLNSQHRTFWITNGIDSKKSTGEIPDGWYKGRKLAGKLVVSPPPSKR